MTDPARPLRWYGSFAVLLFGVVPAVLVSLLVARGDTPRSVGLLLIGGIPLVLAAIFYAVQGVTGADPEFSSRRMHLSMALVAAADVLLLGGNALIRMASA